MSAVYGTAKSERSQAETKVVTTNVWNVQYEGIGAEPVNKGL